MGKIRYFKNRLWTTLGGGGRPESSVVQEWVLKDLYSETPSAMMRTPLNILFQNRYSIFLRLAPPILETCPNLK